MQRPVDRQVTALYDAQFLAFKGTELHAPLSTGECVGFNRTLFERARANGYWTVAYTPTVKVIKDMPNGWAGYASWLHEVFEDSYITLKPEGRRGWIIAHEAAHILLMAGRPSHNLWEAHGKEYAAVFIWTISALFGKKWSNRLKRAFAEARVEAVCSLKED